MADTGFEIHGRFYPAAQSFNLGDPVLVRDLTGLDFPTFAEMYDELVDELAAAQDPDGVMVDPVLLIGLVGVAVWHANPTWQRHKVVRFVQPLEIDAIKFVGGEDDEDENDESPPAAAPADTASGGTPAGSNNSAGATATQNGSGDPTLATGAVSA